jgi:hypothetical protein
VDDAVLPSSVTISSTSAEATAAPPRRSSRSPASVDASSGSWGTVATTKFSLASDSNSGSLMREAIRVVASASPRRETMIRIGRLASRAVSTASSRDEITSSAFPSGLATSATGGRCPSMAATQASAGCPL